MDKSFQTEDFDEDTLTQLCNAINKGLTDRVKRIKTSLSTDQSWYRMLQTTTLQDHNKPLHIAADRGHTKIIEFIRRSLKTDQWYNLLQTTTWPDHNTPLYIAADRGHTEMVELIKCSLKTDQWYKLLQTFKWWHNKTPLYIAAVKGHTEIVELIIKDPLSTDQRYKLLKTHSLPDYETPLYVAAHKGHKDIVKLIKDSVSDDQWYNLLQTTALPDRNTPLRIAADQGQTEIVKLIKVSVSDDQWYNLLQTTTWPEHNTPLYIAADKGHTDIVKLIKDNVSNDQWYNLLQTTALPDHNMPLHIAAHKGHTDIVKLMMKDSVCIDQRYNLLQTTTLSDHKTPLYIAADQGQTEIVKLMKVSVSDDQWYNLLQTAALPDHNTPLYIAADKGQTKIVKLIKVSVSDDQWYNLLQTTTWPDHNTPLYIAADRGHTEIVKLIKDQLSTDQWYKLLQTTWRGRNKPLHIAADKGHTEIVKLIKASLSADQWYELLQAVVSRYCSSPLLLINYIKDISLQKNSKTGTGAETGLLVFSVIKDYFLLHMLARRDDLANISTLLCKLDSKQRSEALALRDANGKTPDQIASSAAVKNLLRWTKDQTGFYLLPTPPAILIMYSTYERPGAKEECNALSKVLPKFTVSTAVKKDLTKGEMLGAIREIQELCDDLSALIVIIMAHGQKGAVQASDGLLDINDILLTMNSGKLEGIPKVLLIQACQTKPSQMQAQHDSCQELTTGAYWQSDVRSSQSVTDTNHFDMKHSDFLVLMATVNGSQAERNMMIPLFAANLSRSGEHEDLYEVFLKTNEDMKAISTQVPEFRSTLQYKLSLRDAFNPNAKPSFFTFERLRDMLS